MYASAVAVLAGRVAATVFAKAIGVEDHENQPYQTHHPISTAKATAQVKYVTNAQGQTTDVIVPIEVWPALLDAQELENPEPDAIAASIHRALADVQAGRTKPLAKLWDSLDAE